MPKEFFQTEYKPDILIRTIYASCKLSGNESSKINVQTILTEKIILQNTKISDFLQIENHRLAYEYLIEHENPNEIEISKIHKILTDRLPHQKRINFPPHKNTHKEKLSKENASYLQNWLHQTQKSMRSTKNLKQKITTLAEAHIKYNTNNQTFLEKETLGRLLLNQILLTENLPPISFELLPPNKYNQIMIQKDTETLSNYIQEQIKLEQARITAFHHAQTQQIQY